MAAIELENIYKTFSDQAGAKGGLENISLNVPNGQIVVVLGPSGCGKSTLLRIIAGLTSADSGVVRYDGRDMSRVPTQQRQIGIVFQSFALYPHFSSTENFISRFLFGRKTVRIKEISEKKLKRSSELLGVNTDDLLGRKIAKMSIGERQRVALGRAITRDPDVLLLDEPLSNLDEKMRVTYRPRIKHLINELQITTIYVTHDQREAVALGDQVVVMNKGRIEQIGDYQHIYNHPANLFVAGFLGLYSDLPAINLLDGSIFSEQYANSILGVRPEDIEISQVSHDKPSINGIIEYVTYNPSRHSYLLELRVGQERIHTLVDEKGPHQVGQKVRLRFKKFHDFEKNSGQRHGISEELRDTLSRYLSPEIAEKVTSNAESNLQKAELKKVSVLFGDFRSFTTFSEDHPPEVVIQTLNEYLQIILGEIRDQGGVVNKFMGDAFLAIWGMAYEQPDDADRAFCAACRILQRLNAYNLQRSAINLPTLEIGLGLHSGYAVTGNVGDSERKEYSVIGDVVNTAQRIESANKDFDTSLLVSEDTYQILSDSHGLTWLKKVKLRGKNVEVGLYSVSETSSLGHF